MNNLMSHARYNSGFSHMLHLIDARLILGHLSKQKHPPALADGCFCLSLLGRGGCHRGRSWRWNRGWDWFASEPVLE